MEFFGGLLLIFGAFIFPLVLIIGLVKPSLFKKPDKTPASRKEIVVGSIVASIMCIAIGGIMLPEVDEELATTANESNKKVTTTTEIGMPTVTQVKTMSEIEEPVANVAPVEVEKVLPDFGMTSDQFVKNYNEIIAKADKNLIINGINDGQTVSYAPMPDNASMSGVISDNGNLRGIILAIGNGGDASDNLKVIAMSLAAANAVSGSVAQEEVSQAVLDIIPAAIDSKGESQKRIINNMNYAANFSEGLGGLFFTIDPVR